MFCGLQAAGVSEQYGFLPPSYHLQFSPSYEASQALHPFGAAFFAPALRRFGGRFGGRLYASCIHLRGGLFSSSSLTFGASFVSLG